jgi:teichuronic acid biosynthesis glycosyltransferase TuaC
MSAPAGTPGRRGHVVLVTTSYPSQSDDPSGHFVATEARELVRDGCRVTVLAPALHGVLQLDREMRDGVEIRWLPAGHAFGWPGALARLRARPWRVTGALRFVVAARRELATLAQAERFVAHFLVPCAFPVAAFAPRPPLEVVVHGSDLGVVERLPAFARRHVARSLGACDVRCVSDQLRDRLGRALGFELARRARVTPSPLDYQGALDRPSARRALGIEPRARLVVVVGRLVPAKRCERALRAAQLVPGARAVVVGDGPERERLERRFPEAHFAGQLPRAQALTWIAAADVLLSASEREGAPSVVREARALGTRVVAVPCGDLGAWSARDPGLSVLDGAL